MLGTLKSTINAFQCDGPIIQSVMNASFPSITEAERQQRRSEIIGQLQNAYAQAVAVVCREGRASTSFVQRQLQIGYNRAARIIERMEDEGIVSAANHVGKREVLARGGD